MQILIGRLSPIPLLLIDIEWKVVPDTFSIHMYLTDGYLQYFSYIRPKTVWIQDMILLPTQQQFIRPGSHHLQFNSGKS